MGKIYTQDGFVTMKFEDYVKTLDNSKVTKDLVVPVTIIPVSSDEPTEECDFCLDE